MTTEHAYLTKRIAATEDAIEACEAAELALLGGRIQTYHIDSGQGKQSVTRVDLPALRRQIDALRNRRQVDLATRDGSGTTQMRPGW